MPPDIDPSEWRNRSLYVATPMYGGACTGAFTSSMLALQGLCLGHGITMMHSFVFNESLITRARNTLAHTFIESRFSHLMFIDSDIGFDASDVIAMLGLMTDESGYDVMAGVYPSKTIRWDRVRQAAKADRPDLSRSGSRFVVKLQGAETILIDQPAKAIYAGTGFMMIRRQTFDLLKQTYPDSYYISDHEPLQTGQDPEIYKRHMFFQADTDPVSKTYLSEDYWFCHRVIEAGGKIWICPWIKLDHVGMYTYSGSLADLAK